MNFTLLNKLNRNNVTLVALVILIISSVAIYYLAHSINKNNEETYRYITSKQFVQKKTALQNEFKKLDDHLNSLFKITNTSEPSVLKEKFLLLNEIVHHGNIITKNWYIITNEDNSIHSTNILVKTLEDKKNNFIDVILHSPKQSSVNDFITLDGKLYGLMYASQPLKENKRIIYGLTLDVEYFHRYLTSIDESTPNYAYIFTKEGLCIYHPEIEFIGQNIFTEKRFNSASLNLKENLNVLEHKDNTPVVSEYFQLEVLRFSSTLMSDYFDGYIVINFPKFNIEENIKPIKRNTILIFIISISLILLLVLIFNQITKQVYKERNQLTLENEKIHKEIALNQLQQLKEQINPHFLFNSLNSLYMLIAIDSKQAQKFTLNLSKIYRYLITPPEENLVCISKEIAFIEHYIELQKTRFSEEIIFEIYKNKRSELPNKLPYLALQVVVENALKHNIITAENPLLIQVFIEDKYVKVVNTLQPKKEKSISTEFGLSYLEKIYNYYNNKTFATYVSQDTFTCILPLL